MTMKTIYSAVLMAAAFALLVVGVPVHASRTDDRIESRTCGYFLKLS